MWGKNTRSLFDAERERERERKERETAVFSIRIPRELKKKKLACFNFSQFFFNYKLLWGNKDIFTSVGRE